jgi:hypothetical protein
MTLINGLEYVAGASALLSTYLHGRVNRAGPFVAVICAALYLSLNICAGLYVAAVVAAVSVVLNIRNLILWSKSA